MVAQVRAADVKQPSENITAIFHSACELTDMTTPQSAPDDDDSSAEEIAAASDETPTEFIPPEVNRQTEQITAWDEPPTSVGGAVPKVTPEDEIPIAEQLVNEGADEADRERRLAAADPDFEP